MTLPRTHDRENPADHRVVSAGLRAWAEPVYAAGVSTLVLVAVGVLALWSGQPWLFPSLGPTIFLQTVTPDAPAARPWNTLAGHAAGLAAGFATVYALGAVHDPAALAAHGLTTARMLASSIAVGLTIALQWPLRASHPPAAATTLLITLGAMHAGLRELAALVIGISVVAVLGELARVLHPSQRKARGSCN